MDRLWTPWRYAYISGEKGDRRKGVPEALDAYPENHDSVFLNLIGAVRWAIETGFFPAVEAEKAGHILLQAKHHFVCLNAYPYSSGHVLIVPYIKAESLTQLDSASAAEMMHLAQKMEAALRRVYRPDGVNAGINLGEAAGAGVAEHLHMHMLPRWFGDTNFMTAISETRILPETLDVTLSRLRQELHLPIA